MLSILIQLLQMEILRRLSFGGENIVHFGEKKISSWWPKHLFPLWGFSGK